MKDFILEIAETVRYSLEGHAERKDPPAAKTLSCWCAIASAELHRALEENNIDATINVAGCEIGAHVFLTVNDHVLDITATQFPEYKDMPVVFLHEREADQNWYHQPEYEFQRVQDLIKHQKKHRWPKAQIAWPKKMS